MNTRRTRGFTLIELLVVISIIGTLVSCLVQGQHAVHVIAGLGSRIQGAFEITLNGHQPSAASLTVHGGGQRRQR